MRALLLIAALASPPEVAAVEPWQQGIFVCGSWLEALGWERTGTCSRMFLRELVWRSA